MSDLRFVSVGRHYFHAHLRSGGVGEARAGCDCVRILEHVGPLQQGLPIRDGLRRIECGVIVARVCTVEASAEFWHAHNYQV